MLWLLVVISLFSLCCSAGNESCPTWLHLSEEQWCVCACSLGGVIICNNETQQVNILHSFCLTTFDKFPDEAVVGSCLYAQNHGQSTGGKDEPYIEVNKNLSLQDQQLCGYLNRQGQLCGECKSNHFVSAYSYDLKCYKCQNGLIGNTFAYLAVAFIPLTLFLVAVVVFHISVASPQLNLAVLLCQCFSFPESSRVVIQNTQGTKYEMVVRLFSAVYGIWNLDFFRTLIPPICLPLNTLQVIALDYLVAVYPLLLLVCVYVLVTAHDRGCRLVVRLWRPFLWCSARMRQKWNVRHSIIDAFATFLLLSYAKFVSVSLNLFMPTQLFNSRGSNVGRFLYYDATVHFMGSKHFPYALFALVVLVVGVMFPLLLILYPMKWFQVFLNKCNLNSPGLRIFMDCFQGYYRDKTDGGFECRYFSALYPMLRIGGIILYAVTRSNIFFPLLTVIIVCIASAIVIAAPYKRQYELYNKLEVVLLMSIIGFCAGLIIYEFSFDWYQLNPSVLGVVLMAIFTSIPLLYFIMLSVKRCSEQLWRCARNRKSSYDLLDSANLFPARV